MAGDLSQYFNTTNPFMWQEGYNAVENARNKSLADIAATQAATNKSNTMLPAELAHTQALAGQATETARATRQANDVRDAIGVNPQKQNYMAELLSKKSDAEKKQMDNAMETLRAYGTRVANGQQIPLAELQQIETSHPGISKFLTPQTYKQGLKAYDDYVQAGASLQKALLAAQASMYKTDHPAPRGGAGGGKYIPGADFSADLAKAQSASKKVALLETKIPFMSVEEKAVWMPIYSKLVDQANAEKADPNAGKFIIGPDGKPMRQPTAKIGGNTPTAPIKLPPLPPGAKLD